MEFRSFKSASTRSRRRRRAWLEVSKAARLEDALNISGLYQEARCRTVEKLLRRASNANI